MVIAKHRTAALALMLLASCNSALGISHHELAADAAVSNEPSEAGASIQGDASAVGAASAATSGGNGAGTIFMSGASSVGGAGGTLNAGGASSGALAGSSSGATIDPRCTSKTIWVSGASPAMSPGDACIACHSKTPDIVNFAIAGTIYPTRNEPTNCNGIGGATVIITDAQGAEHVVFANSVGNFLLQGTISLPYHARVSVGGNSRVMATAVTSGDCNACHTELGTNGAPGRIMQP